METRRGILAGLLGLVGLSSVSKATVNEERGGGTGGLKLFFSYRNIVINFNQNTGVGNDIGTVEGTITGTILQNFQFIPTSQTTVQTDDRALFTDLDGDQIIFRYVGTGKFITPISDPSTPLGNLMSIGGPFEVTYSVIMASGKYQFLIGRKFPAKLVASNAVNGSPGVFGTVYGEVYSDDVGYLRSALQNSAQ